MTKLLDKAFAEAAKLPEPAQVRIAAHLLQELADDAKWDTWFVASTAQLEQLAAAALEEYRAGRTEELGFGRALTFRRLSASRLKLTHAGL